MQRTDDGRTGWVLGGRVIERSGGTLYGLHRACGDEERRFLGLASKLMLMVCQWFGLKTTRTVSHRFETQNRWRRFVSGQNHSDGFRRFGLKTGGNGF
jgi:hypothetical protein